MKIQTYGNEKSWVTVVLACAGDGSKWKPMVIFKRKTVPKFSNKHGLVTTVQKKGWMDTDRMKMWVQKVWHAQCGGLGRWRSLLVWYIWSSHDRKHEKCFCEREHELGSNSGWITSILQPCRDGQTFLKCGIKSNLDGSEDDLLMITLLLEKCSSLTQRQTSKDSMFSFLSAEFIIYFEHREVWVPVVKITYF